MNVRTSTDPTFYADQTQQTQTQIQQNIIKQQKRLFQQISRRSLPYQIVKYVLLILNIMIVCTTAIITIIVCLLPTIIYEKKQTWDNASSFIRTGNLVPPRRPSQHSTTSFRSPEEELIHLSAQEIDTIRFIRFIILGLSAIIILNQTLAVYGLFKERSFLILIPTVIIGLIGQLTLFILPDSIFILITVYMVFSICYVILLNHLNHLAKEPQTTAAKASMIMSRSASRGRSPSVEQQQQQQQHNNKICCCRCKNCLCNNIQVTGNTQQQMKPPIHHQQQKTATSPYQNPATIYGSLGRRSMEPSSSSTIINRHQTPPTLVTPIYGKASQHYQRSPSVLRPINESSDMRLIDPCINTKIIRQTPPPPPIPIPSVIRGSYLSNVGGNLERSRDTVI